MIQVVTSYKNRSVLVLEIEKKEDMEKKFPLYRTRTSQKQMFYSYFMSLPSFTRITCHDVHLFPLLLFHFRAKSQRTSLGMTASRHWISFGHSSCWILFLYTMDTDLNCDELPAIVNGNYKVSGDYFGARVTYACDEGFYMSGSRERVCQGDGTWRSVYHTSLNRKRGNREQANYKLVSKVKHIRQS